MALNRGDMKEKYQTREALLGAIRDGNEAAGMPKWDGVLSREELAAVTEYVRSLSK